MKPEVRILETTDMSMSIGGRREGQYIDLRSISRPPSRCNIPIISYNSKFRIRWEMLVMVFSLWVAIAEPFNMTFLYRKYEYDQNHQVETYLLIHSIFTDSFFLSDIILNFRTSYKGVTGEEVKNPYLIAHQYVTKGSFIFDLIASIPWFVIEELIPAEYSRSSRMLRLMRLFRLTKFLVNIRLGQTAKYSIKFIELMMFILFFCHWGACIWYEVILIEKEWHTGQDLFYGKNLYEEEMWSQYLYCLYYSIIMLTQGSEVWPVTRLETAISTSFELCGIMITTVLYSNMLFFVDLYMAGSNEIDERIDIVEDISEVLQLPPELRRNLLEYVETIVAKQMNEQEWIEFTENLPGSIRDLVTYDIYSNMLISCHLKEYMDDKAFKKLLKNLEAGTYSPDEIVFNANDSLDKIFIVGNGAVRLYLESLSEHDTPEGNFCYEIGVLFRGEMMGETAVLTMIKRNSYSAIAVNHCVLLKLSRACFNDIFLGNHEVMKNIKTLACKREELQRKLTKDFRTSVPYLSKINSLETEFELSAAVKRKFYKENNFLVKRGWEASSMFYIEQGSAKITVIFKEYPVPSMDCEIILEELKSGSIYGLFSVLENSRNVFNVQLMENSLVEELSHKDLKVLDELIKIKKAKLIFKDTLLADYIPINKHPVNHLDLEDHKGWTLIVTELLYRIVVPREMTTIMKLKRCLVKILSNKGPKTLLSEFNDFRKKIGEYSEITPAESGEVIDLMKLVLEKQEVCQKFKD